VGEDGSGHRMQVCTGKNKKYLYYVYLNILFLLISGDKTKIRVLQLYF